MDSPSPGSRPWLDSISPQQILRAYERFGAQAVYLSDPAAAWLANAGCRPPENFVRPGQKASSRIVELHGRKIGLVFFGSPPVVPRPDAVTGKTGKSASSMLPRTPDAPEKFTEYMKDALEEGRRTGSQVDILIGISPWGSRAEQQFVTRAEGLYHILLGGGAGMGFAFAETERVIPAPRLIWSRPNPEGRSVNLIKIFEWPQGSGWMDWRPGITFEPVQMHLSPSIPDDAEISGILPY